MNRNTIHKTYLKKEDMVKIELNIITPLCIVDKYHGKHIYPCRGGGGDDRWSPSAQFIPKERS
jgi:hypothetical protein